MPLSRRTFLTASTGAAATAALPGTPGARSAAVAASGSYTPTWPSVDRHTPAPEWFQDAKFGIYFHWGVFSVPAYGSEWYPRNMHLADSGANKHHIATYGTPGAWPYHTFIDGGRDKSGTFVQFAPELVSSGGRFDPDEWARLFKAAGARFAGPVAEHHDGFSMWDSKVNEWNSAARGPRLDLLHLFHDAIRGQGLKLLVAMHHAYNFTGYYHPVPAQTDPSLRKLYGQLDTTAANQLWFDKLKEVVDQARPDILYQDFNLDEVDEQQNLNFLSYYYNQAEAWGSDVVATYKDGYNDKGEVFDFERGGPADIRTPYWLTDDSVSSSSWCHTEGIRYYTLRQMLHALIDRVSKNGNMLLNIAPTADGTIPGAQRDVLLGIGDHLGRFGESIYGTRAWEAYGEGPTKMGGGAFTHPKAGTAKDIRFTRNKAGTVLYATVLGWPATTLTSTTLAGSRLDLSTLSSVRLLGPGAGDSTEVDGWTQDAVGLHVPLPRTAPFSAQAYVLKLAFDGPIPPLRSHHKATAYSDVGYAGDRAQLLLGSYTSAQLKAAGLAAHSISSLRLPVGFRVTGFSGDHLTGTSWTFTTDTADLRTVGANDRITSLKVTLDPATWFRFTNVTNGLVLDGGGRVPSGSPLRQWTPNSSPNLQWHAVELGTGHYVLVNRVHGLVIDGAGVTDNGGTAQLTSRRDTDSQQWRITDRGQGAFNLANKATGLVLDSGGSARPGAPVKEWELNTSPNLQWTLTAL
ncbi:alpha-L-fucosidase [Streptomyces sp. bgisy100]|uniref:alpha-L-fucosidase n=1 Tax=Streptomyces sp. bgisy100 TaxID=3413783 RepID=UPI003D75B696